MREKLSNLYLASLGEISMARQYWLSWYDTYQLLAPLFGSWYLTDYSYRGEWKSEFV